MRRALWLAAALLVAAPAVARADEIDTQIQLIRTQPGSMDRVTWKEKRREAAKKLAASGDQRAVSVLVELVETETFDVIGEIAIEGLGQLGDPSAIPVLQRVVDDPSRDSVQREKAKKALAKLGAKRQKPVPDADAGAGAGADADAGADAGAGSGTGTGTGTGTGILGTDTTSVPSGPEWDSDVLAASERLTFAIGSAAFEFDTVRDRLVFDLDVAGRYEKSLDRERSAWRWGLDAQVVAGAVNPDGPETSRLVSGAVLGHGEFRVYGGSELYGIAFGGARFEGSRLSQTFDDLSENSDRWVALDAQIALGGGWGRVLDVGTRMRVARISDALERSRALGRPIDDEIARRLQGAWWSMRGDLGAHRVLTSTIAILRDAGVLLGEPDAGLTYELLEILEDPAYDHRLSGLDVHVAFGEGYLQRWRYPSDEDAGLDEGRLEQLLVRGRLVRQLGDTSDVDASLWARYRLFAPEDDPAAPWAVGAGGRWRTFVYGEHYDPRGALDLGVDVALSDDDLDTTDLGMRVGGELGWTIIVSRASSIRIAGEAALDSGELFVGGSIEAAYGLLDGNFASSLPK